MARTLLQALLRNESGGRNIPNVHQGTSSGQAQGYFQITTGTWDEFGGRKYAATPLDATYEQQADIASRIPLKRWDPSTIALMRATGRRIDPNLTLGENLAAAGESFDGGARDGGGGQYSLTPRRHVGGAGSTLKSFNTPAAGYSGVDAAGASSGGGYTPPVGGGYTPLPLPGADKKETKGDVVGKGFESLADAMTFKPLSIPEQRPASMMGGGGPMPSVFRPQLMPTSVMAGAGGMGGQGGGQDLRAMLAQLMGGMA